MSRIILPFSLACVLAAGGLAFAAPEGRSPQPAETYASAREALRSGMRDYNAGDKASAVKALEFAAEQGYPLAAWKLARMYAEGDGVPRDDLKAYEYFLRIVDDSADEAPNSARAGVVASAFVAVGSYLLDGIKNTFVKTDPERAVEMYQYAASYFGDPDAQYHLARLYLEGTGLERDERQAARWFNLAAAKGHLGAQAFLGRMLVNGQGVPRQRARGLMWLELAKQGADPKRDGWIAELHAQAFDGASESDRRSALAYMEQMQARRR